MTLSEEFSWQGRRVRWTTYGQGAPVVFCHGTPWSSVLWRPFADALAKDFTVYLWDMPGYGQSSKDHDHRVSLDVQGQVFADLLEYWDVRSPHVVAHDYGGATVLRAHLLHGARYASLALMNVVALAPWGSEFFRLVGDHADVFDALPPAVHEGVVRAYISGASHQGLTDDELHMLTEPWLDPTGHRAFYRQMAQAHQVYTDEVEPLYPSIDIPVLVAWGAEDTWIPVDRAHRLAKVIPSARLEVIHSAGHLIQLDQPVAVATTLHGWLREQTP